LLEIQPSPMMLDGHREPTTIPSAASSFMRGPDSESQPRDLESLELKMNFRFPPCQ
ncbi:Hypothetical predicted protein, partial [Marmota monax]